MLKSIFAVSSPSRHGSETVTLFPENEFVIKYRNAVRHNRARSHSHLQKKTA